MKNSITIYNIMQLNKLFALSRTIPNLIAHFERANIGITFDMFEFLYDKKLIVSPTHCSLEFKDSISEKSLFEYCTMSYKINNLDSATSPRDEIEVIDLFESKDLPKLNIKEERETNDTFWTFIDYLESSHNIDEYLQHLDQLKSIFYVYTGVKK